MSTKPSPDSLSVELATYKRSTELYLRSLWGVGFNIQMADAVENDRQPLSYLKGREIFLPASISTENSHLLYFRAAATHASLHAIYRDAPLLLKSYNLMQRTVIGLVEDLRVEMLAMQRFPGLRRLWARFHGLRSEYFDNAQDLLLRLSRCIVDPGYQDEHQWVNRGKAMLLNAGSQLIDQDFSLHTGLQLANELGQMRLPLNSGRYEQGVVYRDDNRCLWYEVDEARQQSDAISAVEQGMVNASRLRESDQGMQLRLSETEGKDSDAHYVRQRETAVLEYRQFNDSSQASALLYPEWDYRTRVLKQDWCTLRESTCKTRSASSIEDIFEKHKIILARLRIIARRMQIEKRQRVRKLEDGDEVDLDPMINAMVSARSGETPDPRVFMREDYRATKSLAVSILLDLSESTNETVTGTDVSVSNLMRDAVLLLGETLAIADEQFSITGFSSNGRHEVNISRFKSFDESFAESRSRLAGVNGQYSTRLGAAIRHSGKCLARRPEAKKVLLVITDGVPSDIDVFDRRYLEYDSKHAINDVLASGIKTFCLNLDSRADGVIEHIFGRGRYETLERLTRLPEVLSYLYIKHVRH